MADSWRKIFRKRSEDNSPQNDIDNKRILFEKLAFEHIDSLYSTALRMTKNASDAEDLLQETFLKAFRFFEKFERGTNFKAWIFKILTNSYINRYRKQSKVPQQVSYEDVAPFQQDDVQIEPQEQQVEDVELVAFTEEEITNLTTEIFDDQIKQAIDELPFDFKIVLILSDIEGFSYKEIASMLHIPIGTVMSRLYRGRKLLQKALYDYAVENGYIKSKL